ncbi:MAG: hypothetical protein QOE68_1180 [Thermoanaerobaculia bacterium]|jgi:hypothetical protein|nr:hypothetical protein [Thermoanaerobaculia bacterium]
MGLRKSDGVTPSLAAIPSAVPFRVRPQAGEIGSVGRLSGGSVTKTLAIGGLLILALTAVSMAGARKVDLGLPPALAGYREWTQLIKVPYEVPLELWIRCVAPTPKDWESARARYGPHAERFIRVYGNPPVARSLAEN